MTKKDLAIKMSEAFPDVSVNRATKIIEHLISNILLTVKQNDPVKIRLYRQYFSGNTQPSVLHTCKPGIEGFEIIEKLFILFRVNTSLRLKMHLLLMPISIIALLNELIARH